MKKLILSAAMLLAAASTVTAGGEGRTICVIRQRPLAISPPPPSVVYPVLPVVRTASVPRTGYYGYAPGYGYTGYYNRVPVVYGHVNPRLHYVDPCKPNGYVGGIQNLPTNYVNIPPAFTRVQSYPSHRPAPVHAAPVARPAPRAAK